MSANPVRHGGDVTTTPLGAQWTPVRHQCGTVVQFLARSMEQSAVLFCGHCKREVPLSETDSSGRSVVVVPAGADARAGV